MRIDVLDIFFETLQKYTSMSSVTFFNQYKKINNSTWLEWVFRIFISSEFVYTTSVLQEEHYPDVCWWMIFISIWCYFFRLKLLGLVPLVFCMLIHHWH